MKDPSADFLAALQRGLPLVPRPFAALAAELGAAEEDLIACVGRCRREGLVRRFGAVFDTRRLGYSSALCAAGVPAEALDRAAALVTPLKGVTHCYVREDDRAALAAYPRLWFTLSYPKDVFGAMADEVRARLAPYGVSILPATRRYKIDVVFGAATRQREEEVADDTPVTALDRTVIRVLQGDTDVRPDYFSALAEKTNLTEWALLSRLEIWRRQGRLKRLGLVMRHRAAGYLANGMCCWRVRGDTAAAGRALAACPEVTHCYERAEAPNFPFNLYAMIHAKTLDEARATFARVEGAAGLSGGAMLVSTREYKKTSMTFFTD